MTQPQTAPKPAAAATPATAKAASKKAALKGSEGAEKKESKPRAPRKDYGYNVNSKIVINKDKEVKFNGQRADWYKLLCEFDGKTVNDFEGKVEELDIKDSPRGWLRFFATEGYCTLEKPVEKAA